MDGNHIFRGRNGKKKAGRHRGVLAGEEGQRVVIGKFSCRVGSGPLIGHGCKGKSFLSIQVTHCAWPCDLGNYGDLVTINVAAHVDSCVPHKAGIQSGWRARCREEFLLSSAVMRC